MIRHFKVTNTGSASVTILGGVGDNTIAAAASGYLSVDSDSYHVFRQECKAAGVDVEEVSRDQAATSIPTRVPSYGGGGQISYLRKSVRSADLVDAGAVAAATFDIGTLPDRAYLMGPPAWIVEEAFVDAAITNLNMQFMFDTFDVGGAIDMLITTVNTTGLFNQDNGLYKVVTNRDYQVRFDAVGGTAVVNASTAGELVIVIPYFLYDTTGI